MNKHRCNCGNVIEGKEEDGIIVYKCTDCGANITSRQDRINFVFNPTTGEVLKFISKHKIDYSSCDHDWCIEISGMWCRRCGIIKLV